MTQTSRFWEGTTVGDATAAPYDAATEFAAVLRSLTGAQSIDTHLSGVFRDDLDSLAVSGTASPVTVATGRALAHGTWYQNDAAVQVAVATPSGATRIDRIVLRKDWDAQTVRITRIEGVEGGGAPSLTQSAGDVWDTPLAQASITTGGVITVTDERDFLAHLAVTERLTALVDIVSSTTETTIASYTIPANSLGGEGRIRLIAIADFLNNVGVNRGYTLRVKWGGSTIASIAYTGGISTNANRRSVYTTVDIMARGAANSQVVLANHNLSLAAASGTMTTKDSDPLAVVPTAVDTTVDTTLELTIQLEINSASLQFRSYGSTLERL